MQAQIKQLQEALSDAETRVLQGEMVRRKLHNVIQVRWALFHRGWVTHSPLSTPGTREMYAIRAISMLPTSMLPANLVLQPWFLPWLL
jgi:hypothetical protein